ncbi:MAG: hypothetical protein ACK4YP_07375 [Myxococcota bacterium]
MLFLLLACAPASECADGFTLRDDGLCYATDDGAPDDEEEPAPEAEPPTVEDLLLALPACEPTVTDGRVDLYAGCADGICSGMTYDQIVTEAGEPDDCYTFWYTYDGHTGGSLNCAWAGVDADFDDTDHDGVADVGSSTYGVGLTGSHDGGTTTGLGIGATFACFVDELGYPDSVRFEALDKDWLVTSMSWSEHSVYAYDYYDARGGFEPDGVVDTMTMYGSTAEF